MLLLLSLLLLLVEEFAIRLIILKIDTNNASRLNVLIPPPLFPTIYILWYKTRYNLVEMIDNSININQGYNKLYMCILPLLALFPAHATLSCPGKNSTSEFGSGSSIISFLIGVDAFIELVYFEDLSYF